ncbi:hypothetical protein [Geobacter sp.]|uniref:hypothetical protein n=1 Tax=Geobacter sp. TaxID=46610 RepID=UPI0027B8BCFB|nr:hypothetical protein [Geobacter sp.]
MVEVIYEVGGIPDLPAWAGTTLAFRIDTGTLDAGFPPAMAVDHHPAGQISFDPASGAFSYEAQQGDKLPFTVTFSGQREGKAISQSVVITPVPRLPAERDYIVSHPAQPDPASSLYIHRSVKPNADGSENHLVTGMRVVFDRFSNVNNLHVSYNVDRTGKLPDAPDPKGTVRSLTLCADQLVIRGELSLPETDVTIFARELVFEDLDSQPGRIDTSPLAYALEKAADAQRTTNTPGGSGQPGRRAGNVKVYLKNFQVPQETSALARFVMKGGNGQHAGLGENGPAGEDRSHIYGQTFTCDGKPLSVTFDPPAVYWKWHYKWAAFDQQKTWGAPNFPTSGKDALPPGTPGDGGDGGAFTANRDLAPFVDNTGGAAGNPGVDVHGGRPGYPLTSAQYEVTIWYNLFTGPHFDGAQPKRSAGPETTHAGKSYPAPQAAKPRGSQPAPTLIQCPNAWLHPLQLQTVLQFVRDAYLAEDRETVAAILADYRDALMMDPPAETGWGTQFDISRYYATQAEVVTLLHRLQSHLDYYGNPAGWTPLLSLQANLQLYENEIADALRTLVLVSWISQEAVQTENAAAAMQSAIQELDKDAAAAVKEVQAAEKGLREISDRIYSLSHELSTLNNDLAALQERLLAEAHNTMQTKALINLGVKTFSAICSVIPYGQPALGAVGSMATVMADYATGGDEPLDTAGRLGGILATYGKAKLDEKAGEITKAADKKKPDPEADKAKEKAAQLTHVGKTIGPAVAQISEALTGLRVPQSEVDAELARLEAKTPEFSEMVKKIQGLNRRKAAFAEKLDETLQAFGGAYGRIASNLLAMGTLTLQERDTLAHLDHEALLFTRDLGQRARQTLVKYLYYLIKSYETSVLRPIDSANYQLTDIFDKISDLLQAGESRSKLDVTKLGVFADQLKPLFRDNLSRIEHKLIEDFRPEYTIRLESRLSADQTSEIIQQLNGTGEAVINLRESGLILPDREKVKIADIEVAGLGFGEQPLPAGGTLEITLEPLGDGTIRSEDRLYAVRHPAGSGQGEGSDVPSQQIWGATYHFSNRQLSPIKPSSESLALLGYLLRETDDKTKEKLAKPAAWTDLRIRYRRYVEGGPDLDSLLLTWQFNFATPSTTNRYVLDVRTDGGTVPLIQCSPPDINERSDGFGSLYRIYRRATPITLAAPLGYGDLLFSHWEIINTDTMKSQVLHDPSCSFSIENNLRIICAYQEKHPTVMVAMPKIRTRGKQLTDEMLFKALVEASEAGTPLSSAILNQPSVTTGLNRGYLPDKAEFTTLEGPREGDGLTWYKIDYRGIVGWVHEVRE